MASVNTLKITKAYTRKQLTADHLNCGSCAGLHREDLKDNGIDKSQKPPKRLTCSGMGITAGNSACPKFKPDVFTLNEIVPHEATTRQNMETVSAMMNSVPTSKLPLIASVIIYEETTRKYGYKLWQKVFIRYRGTSKSDYLSNFMSGRVLWADKNHINLVSDQEGKDAVTITIPYSDSEGSTIYTEEQFKVLRKEMKRKKRYVDPVEERNALKSATPVGEDSLNLLPNAVRGAAFADGEMVLDLADVTKANGRKNKKGSSAKPYDLVQQARDMSAGHVVDKSAARNFGKKRKRSSQSGEIEFSRM